MLTVAPGPWGPNVALVPDRCDVAGEVGSRASAVPTVSKPPGPEDVVADEWLLHPAPADSALAVRLSRTQWLCLPVSYAAGRMGRGFGMTSTATTIPEAVATARLFRVLSDPTRVAILDLLMDRPHNVSELVEATRAEQSRVSTHLACLRWCGFVVGERSGRNVIYSIVDPEVGRLVGDGMAMAESRLEHLLSCTRIGPDWA